MSDKINTSPEALDTIVKELTDPCEASGTNDLGLLIAALDIERDALSARVAEFEAKNRELALEVISANGQAIDAYDAQKAAEEKLALATEHAFKEGLRYSINVKISDEHDVQTAWDWSKLKQKTLAEIQDG